MADPTLTGATITFQTNDDVDALCGRPLDSAARASHDRVASTA